MTRTVERLLTEHLDTWTAAVETKSAAGRGSSKKLKLVGIAKLRELILELAVRGQLVPQDESDEPASVLLERIAAERERLVQEKKIKKQKALPEISEGEKSFGLPKGWAWCRLSSIVLLLGDGLHGTPEYVSNGEYFFINGNNLKNGKIVLKPETKKVNEEQYQKYKKDLGENTVLVSINGTLGNVAFYNNEKVMLGKSACYFNLADGVSKSFIKLLLESPMFQQYAQKSATGSTIKNLGLKAMNALPFGLPALSEQNRIITKVDELMALCDALEQEQESSIVAHGLLVESLLAALTNAAGQGEFKQAWTRVAAHFDTLFTTEQSVEQLKQTILQLAVMGKLVEQDPADEPAGVLLERIAAEKARLVEEKVIKKQKILPEISEEEKTYELPVGWAWCRVGEFTITGTGSTPSRDNPNYYFPAEHAWVTSGETAKSFIYSVNERISSKALKETNVTIYRWVLWL